MGCVPNKKQSREGGPVQQNQRENTNYQENNNNNNTLQVSNNNIKEGSTVRMVSHNERLTEQQVIDKRQAMKHSLQEGHDRPPTVQYPRLQPISTID